MTWHWSSARACGHRVSTTAPRCPNCGGPGPAAGFGSATTGRKKGTATRGFCTKCGRSMPLNAIACPACGAARHQSAPQPSTLQGSSAAPTQSHPGSGQGAEAHRNPGWPITTGGVIAAAAIVLYLLPGLFASNTESRFRQAMRQLSADGVPLTVNAYDAGWFSSLATTSLLLNGRPIRLIHRIWHGPFVAHAGWESLLPVAAVIDTSVELPNNTDPQTREIFSKVSLRIESSVSPTGATAIRISSLPFVYRDGENALSSAGMAAAFHVANDLSEASGTIETGDASIHPLAGDPALRGFVLRGFVLRGRAYQGVTGVWQGNLDLRIDQFRDRGPNETSVSNFSFAAKTDLREGTLDFELATCDGALALLRPRPGPHRDEPKLGEHRPRGSQQVCG